jgi:quercetin dioxygenase-like cupin family protein
MKWGVHRKGESRRAWAVGRPDWSLSILVSGHFTITFVDSAYELTSPGDFVIWGPGVEHSWNAHADSVVVTVRWREQDGATTRLIDE